MAGRTACWIQLLLAALVCWPAGAVEPAGSVAITIDDGPNPDFTAASLEVFGRYGVQVTYFLCGNMVQAHPGLAKAVATAGHEIGNHSFNHPDMTTLSAERMAWQIRHTNEVIEQAAGVQPRYFRPPYGKVDRSVRAAVDSAGMATALWNVDPADWRHGATVASITRGVTSHLRDGAVILLHEKKTTLAALPGLIEGIRSRGYRITTYHRLLHPVAAQPEPTWIETIDSPPAGGWTDARELRFRLPVPTGATGTLWLHLGASGDGPAAQSVSLNGERLGSFRGQVVVRTELTADDTSGGELKVVVRGVDGAMARVRGIGFRAGSSD